MEGMMSRVKNGHYVPQFYLRRFAQDGRTVFVFDKGSRNVFRANIANVANENGFYDLPPTVGGDHQRVEKTLSNLEGQTAAALTELLAEVETHKCFNAFDQERRFLLS